MQNKFLIGAGLAALALAGCATTDPTPPAAEAQAAAPVEVPVEPAAAVKPANPILVETTGLAFNAPRWNELTPAHYSEALEQGMTEHRAEIEAIANQAEPATFANTIEALELTGDTLVRTINLFFGQVSAHTNEALDAINTEYSPKLSRHDSAIYLNPKLFARVDAVYQGRAAMSLTPEQARLLERTHLAFVRAGARLDEAGRARIAEVDAKIAALQTEFDQKLLADTAQWELVLEEKDLEGIPQTMRDTMAAAAKAKDKPGKYLVTLQRPSVEPFLTFSSRRDLRETAFKAWAARNDKADAEDTKALIIEAVKLRDERAKLLGYPNHAAFVLDDRMAKTPAAARALMDKVWAPARKAALADASALQKMIDAEKGGFKLAAWDWRYYAEKVRAAKYDLSDAETKPYFELNRMLEASFWTAEQLFGVRVVERKDLPVYEPSVRVFEMQDAVSGKTIGLFYGDFYARPNKNSGAWMNSYVQQKRAGGAATPIAAYHLNYNKPEAGQPTLLTYGDAQTLFHEFGHVLHGLLSNVDYASLSGTNVARDYVEFPSQVMENWVLKPQVLSRFAKHAETGEVMPQSLLDKISRAENYGQGFATVEYLASAYADLDLHTLPSYEGLDLTAFEAATLKKIGMPNQIIMRHRLPHFGHIMGGYSAGYYSYLWSDVLASDAFEAFSETGNVFDPAVAQRFKTNIFAAGNARDPMANYQDFRGRAPDAAALLRSRGLAK